MTLQVKFSRSPAKTPKKGALKDSYEGPALRVIGELLVDMTRAVWGKHSRRIVMYGGIAAAVAGVYGCTVNHVDSHEVGLAWNRVTGNLWVQHGGFHVTWPWVAVSNIDTRPVRVCVTSSSRAFSCKLVRFDPSGFREFVATEGHYYYWWANRISYNGGYVDEYRGMKDILRGYAYGSEQYPFVRIEGSIASP